MFFRKPKWHKDWKIAQKAFDQQDYPHAVHHLGAVLLEDQANEQALKLLNRIIGRVEAPEELVPVSERMWTGDGAMKAYIHAYCGEYDTATMLLAQIIHTSPGSPFLAWLADWLEQAQNLDPVALVGVLTLLNQKYGIKSVLSPNDPAVPYLERIAAQPADLPADHELIYHYVFNQGIFLRRLGKFDQAINLLKTHYDAHPNQMVGTVLATTYKFIGQLDVAWQLNRDVLALPQGEVDLNIEILLELGDTALDLTRLDEALTYYEQALSTEPDQSHAVPLRLYTQYLITGDPQWKTQLADYAAANPQNPSATGALEQLSAHDLYRDYLEFDYEAILNAIRQIERPTEAGKKLRIEFDVSALEAPSAFLAAERHLSALGFDPVEIKIENVMRMQQPDPRQPLVEVEYTLWDYDGVNATPAVPPPADHVAQAIAELAQRPFNIRNWPYHARKIAEQLGDEALDDVLRVMVHPPANPAEVAFWDWMHYVQIAAALTLVYMGSEPWADSRRRQTLRALALGPLDWTVEAAIIALVQAAREDSTSREDVIALFRTLVDQLPDHGMIPYKGALMANVMRIPALPREMAQHILQAFKARD